MLRLPWLIALAGLATPLLGSELQLWAPVAFWLVMLATVWIVGHALPIPREARILLAVALVPLLFQAGFLGGWWLLPANLTWLAIEWRTRVRPRAPRTDLAS
jgi:hypothetical protein